MTKRGGPKCRVGRVERLIVLAGLFVVLNPLWAAGTVPEDAAFGAAEGLEVSGPGADRILSEGSARILDNPGALLGEARVAAENQDWTQAIGTFARGQVVFTSPNANVLY